MDEPIYTAKVIEKVDNGKGYWNSLNVGVFRGREQIGNYHRNYSSLYSTFYPFEQGGRWYALYSPHYTATRVLSLPDCIDLGGEEPASNGFCPVQFYVPELVGQDLKAEDPAPRRLSDEWTTIVKLDNGGLRHYYPDSTDHPQPDEARRVAYLAARAEQNRLFDEWLTRNPFVSRFAPWGFVAGCHWGDDSNWKIQFLDLSRVSEGVVTRDERFGYIELPRSVDLKEAIDTDSIDRLSDPLDKQVISIALPTRFSMTGQRLEE